MDQSKATVRPPCQILTCPFWLLSWLPGLSLVSFIGPLFSRAPWILMLPRVSSSAPFPLNHLAISSAFFITHVWISLSAPILTFPIQKGGKESWGHTSSRGSGQDLNSGLSESKIHSFNAKKPIFYHPGFEEIVGFPGGPNGKEPACQCRKPKRRRLDPWVGKEMATHSSILAWEIPWTEEPDRLQSMWS